MLMTGVVGLGARVSAVGAANSHPGLAASSAKARQIIDFHTLRIGELDGLLIT
jgi:hypothetical protein